jgi:hypothetical protein
VLAAGSIVNIAKEVSSLVNVTENLKELRGAMSIKAGRYTDPQKSALGWLSTFKVFITPNI